jgi:cob(I)alamin adenosyltransferase
MVSTILKDRIKEEDITFIEELIYDLENKTGKIDGFIIPGENILDASSHFARTICRRAERQIVAMRSSLDENSFVIPFINRLSDFFFIFAVYLSKNYK